VLVIRFKYCRYDSKTLQSSFFALLENLLLFTAKKSQGNSHIILLRSLIPFIKLLFINKESPEGSERKTFRIETQQ